MDPLLMGLTVPPAPDPGIIDATVFTIFARAYEALSLPLQNSVNAIIDALLNYLHGPMKAFIVFWLAATAIAMALAPDGWPIQRFFTNVLRAAVVYFLVANAGNFTHYVSNMLLVTIPQEIGLALTNAVGGGGTPTAGIFDQIWNKAYAAGLICYSHLPNTFKGALLCIVVFAFWVAALIAVGLCFLFWTVSFVLLSLVVSLGPIFVSLALFPVTRRFFEGWLSAAVGAITTQTLVVALLVIMIRVEQEGLDRIVRAPANSNEIGTLGALLGVGALLGICAYMVKQIPSISVGISGGVYHNFSVYSAAMAGAAQRAGNAASAAWHGAGQAASAIGNIGSTTSSMSMSPPGRSLSAGRP